MICQCEISSDQTVKADNSDLALHLWHRFPTYLHALSAALDRKEMRVNLPTQTRRDLDKSLAYQGLTLMRCYTRIMKNSTPFAFNRKRQ